MYSYSYSMGFEHTYYSTTTVETCRTSGIIYWLAISERVDCVDRARAIPFTYIRIQRIERNVSLPFSLFSSLSGVRWRWCNTGGGPAHRRTLLAARDISSAVSSCTSARNRQHRARMLYRDLTWSPSRHFTWTRRLDRGHQFHDNHNPIFTFVRPIPWIWGISKLLPLRDQLTRISLDWVRIVINLGIIILCHQLIDLRVRRFRVVTVNYMKGRDPANWGTPFRLHQHLVRATVHDLWKTFELT